MKDVKFRSLYPMLRHGPDQSEFVLPSNACFNHRTTIQLVFDFSPDKMHTNQLRITHYQQVLLTAVSWHTNSQRNRTANFWEPESQYVTVPTTLLISTMTLAVTVLYCCCWGNTGRRADSLHG